ncbi:MAG TPA: hypothetical protein VMD30_11635 [Tepidisphaeraceae bacterium]|nr:hypothetical protein [Tepidisphaeraceae bacterium]
MFRISRWIGAFCLLFAATALAQSTEDAQALLTATLRGRLESFKKLAADPGNSITTRDFPNAAYLSLLLGEDPHVAEIFLDQAYDTQNMVQDSPVFGQLRWQTGDMSVTDLNAIEFGAQAVGPILLSYGDKFSPDFVDHFQPHLAAAVAAIQAHDVPVSYTNIYLMKTVNLMLLGEATGEVSLVHQGQKMLDNWIDYTRKNGVHEFDSPTYYGVDLDTLALGYHYTVDPAYREKFRRILDYFWTDIGANYFAPAQKISAPYSRDYDFLAGNGMLDTWLAAEGWGQDKWLGSRDLQGVYILDNFRPGGYQPPGTIVQLSQSGPRQIVSAWDDDPAHQRVVWMGQRVAMGSTSGNYGEQDKLFGVTFAGPPQLPQVTLVGDAFDAPYGFRTQADSTGHMKPVHIPLNLGSVQSRGAALLTMNIDPGRMPRQANELATNILLPIAATVSIDGKPIKFAANARIDERPDSCITIACDGGYVALRFIHIDSLAGQTPGLALVCDGQGKSKDAMRFKLTSDSGARPSEHHLRLALLAVAADTDPTAEATAARISDETRGDTWTISATVGDLTLKVARSITDRTQIDSQEINGSPCKRYVLAVNGKPVGLK